jgi:hypothetical protein
MRLEKKGSGAVVFVGNKAVKASSVSRAFSMKNLVKRLGPFASPPLEASTSGEEVEPVSAVNHREWVEYQAQHRAERVGEENTVELRKELTTQLRDMKARHREEMRCLRSRLAKYGLPLLNIAMRCLKIRQHDEFRALQVHQRVMIHHKTNYTFEGWLRTHGMEEQADCWRHRVDLERLAKAMRNSAKVNLIQSELFQYDSATYEEEMKINHGESTAPNQRQHLR